MSQITIERNAPGVLETELRDRLAQEFQQPTPGRVPPLFQIDRSGVGVHLLVVWSEWRSLSLHERSRMVLEAYERAFGEPEMLKVSVALGLTPDEADRMGYAY